MTDIPTPPEDPPEESAVIKELREKANRTQAAEAETSALKREMAFDRAGVPTEGPASYFRKAYDGDVTPEAIRAEAEAAGLLSPAAPEVPAHEAQEAAAISSAMAGGTPPAPTDLNEKLREAGKNGYGDIRELDQAIADLNLTSEDFERISRHPYAS